MAKSRRNSSPLSLLLLLLLLFFVVSVGSTTATATARRQTEAAGGGILLGRRSSAGGRNGNGNGEMVVGGRAKVEDVKTNKEIQELGKYCVEQYNRRSSNGSSSKPAVVFVKVVEAERQVVSGIKYYLKISAISAGSSSSSSSTRTFNAVVVVKPWIDSKEMLCFSPSPSSPSIQ